MPEFTYIELEAGTNGTLLQDRGTLTEQQLLNEESSMRTTVARGWVNRIRLMTPFTPVAGDDAVPANDDRLHQALAEWLSTSEAQTRFHAPAPLLVRWHRGRLKALSGQTRAESLDVWLRNAPLGDVLIEVKVSNPEAISAARDTIKKYLGSLLFRTRKKSGVIRDRKGVYIHLRREAALTPDRLPTEQAASAKRTALASDWPTAAQVSQSLGSTAENGSQYATKLRREGKLLGVYMVSPHHHYRFPLWQFGLNGQPVDQFAEILSVLREQGPFLDSSRRTTGWGEVEWFISPHVLLNDATPAEQLANDPTKVLAAAQAEFGEGT